MPGIILPIKSKTTQNAYFRQVLFTSQHMQVVVMDLKPLEDIGKETHTTVDQFLRIEAGEVTVFLDGQELIAKSGDAIVVPAGVEHNVINRSNSQSAKIYTIYAPPQHADGTIHATKAEAIADEHDHA